MFAIAFHPEAVIDPLDATWVALGMVLGALLSWAVRRLAARRHSK